MNYQRHAEVSQAMVNKGYPQSIKNLSLDELDRIQQMECERIMHPAIYPLGEVDDLNECTIDELEARIDSCLELASTYERRSNDDFRQAWERMKYSSWAERVMEVADELEDLIEYRNNPPTW